MNSLGPIVFIMAGVLLIGEPLGPSPWLGVVLVGAGLFLLAIG